MEKDIKDFKNSINKIITDLKSELVSMRGSRPTARMVEDIEVEAYGQSMPIKQLGSISIIPPREINISTWDHSVADGIAKAVSEAMGVNPNIDGSLIRINLPPLTDERRKDLIRTISKITEEARIKIRSAREYINKKIDKAEAEGDITEDAKFRYRDEVQKAVDEVNKEADNLLKQKTADIESV